MCGISGVYAKVITNQHRHINNAIITSQSARGPDYQAELLISGNHNQLVLGHNRLSIIDLSNDANQPMWDITGRYCIVYNGEIYNYLEVREQLKKLGLKFYTNSDTEVILNAFAAWGIDSLQYLQGPFAYALYDKQTENIWLCRDRFGVRPLYYIKHENVMYFASTTSALAKHLGLKANLSYVARGLHYLVYEDGSESTPYHQLFSVPAGNYLHAQFNTQGQLITVINPYYNLKENVERLIINLPIHNTDAMLDLVQNKLAQAVKIRLRSDVPLAISLSGGLDSSSVAAMVSQQHENTIGFSFAHPSMKQSEGPIVADCAKFLNIKMEYVWPDANEMVAALHKTIEAQDAPFSSLSVVAQYMLYQKVRSSGIRVLLGGQGGDEAFMGYKKFLLFNLQQSLRQKKYIATATKMLQLLPMVFSEMASLTTYWQHRHRYLGRKRQIESALQLPDYPPLQMNTHQALWQRQMQDVTQFSLPTLLRYEDRNAMGNSVESRLPFMDHEIIELGLALPEAIKLRGGYGKWAIRQIMHKQIPNTIRLARYKRGFDISIDSLINAGLGKVIRSSLHDHMSNVKDFFQPDKNVENAFSDQQLLHRKNAISEAITLLWLNKVSI